MDISKKKKQLVVNNVFLLSIFILIIYSLGFIIRIGKHSLISNYLGFAIPAYINIALCLILLVLVIFVLLYNKNKINPKLSLIFVSIAIIYTIYLMLYGRLVSGISYNEILSNVKNIWMMSLLGFISLVIVPRIITKKNINFILYFCPRTSPPCPHLNFKGREKLTECCAAYVYSRFPTLIANKNAVCYSYIATDQKYRNLSILRPELQRSLMDISSLSALNLLILPVDHVSLDKADSYPIRNIHCIKLLRSIRSQ